MTDKPIEETRNNTENEELSQEFLKIAQWLKKLRFRKKIFGGVCEQDVWKKIGELNAMYDEALRAERIRYDALIEHYRKSITSGSHEEIAVEEDY
ncbi:MAG: hypothetical protein GXX01_07075 [Clostridiales bacterium]|nr:hypothetical protein [Clostridiales bacterium]